METPSGEPLSGPARLWTRLCDVVEWTSRTIIGVSIAAIVLITIVSVIYRYGLNAPLSWTEQVCRILFVWSVFAGAAVLYRHMLHIAIDMFAVMLPPAAQRVLFWINQVLMLFVGAMMLRYGLQISIANYVQTYGALEITPTWFYAAAPFCGLAIILFWVEKLLNPAMRGATGEVHI